MATSFDEFLQDIEPELPKCPVPIIERRLRETLIEACELANIWVEDLVEVPIITGQTDYELPVPGLDLLEEGETPESVVQLVLHLEANGRTLYPAQDFAMHTLGLIELYNTPKRDTVEGKGMVATVSLKPSRTALTVGDVVFDNWHNIIIHGTIYKTCEMENRVWSSLPRSKDHRNIFEKELAKARRTFSSGNVRQSRHIHRQPFVPSSGRHRSTDQRRF